MTRQEIIEEIEDILAIKLINSTYYRMNLLLNKIVQLKVVYRDRVVHSQEVMESSFKLEEQAIMICQEYGISLKDLRGKSRRYNVVQARAHFCRLMKTKYSNITSVSLADFLNRDHSSIIHYFYYYKGLCPIGRIQRHSEMYE